MSQRIRVYLPATMPALARLHAEGALAATEGYAVTPALQAELGETDAEELSYAAYRLAADASLGLLRADPSAPDRRVVVSADVPARPVPDGEPGAVRPAGPVPLAAVAAIHVDDVAAELAVASARATAGESVDEELAWYDPSELAQLLA